MLAPLKCVVQVVLKVKQGQELKGRLISANDAHVVLEAEVRR